MDLTGHSCVVGTSNLKQMQAFLFQASMTIVWRSFAAVNYPLGKLAIAGSWFFWLRYLTSHWWYEPLRKFYACSAARNSHKLTPPRRYHSGAVWCNGHEHCQFPSPFRGSQPPVKVPVIPTVCPLTSMISHCHSFNIPPWSASQTWGAALSIGPKVFFSVFPWTTDDPATIPVRSPTSSSILWRNHRFGCWKFLWCRPSSLLMSSRINMMVYLGSIAFCQTSKRTLRIGRCTISYVVKLRM